MKFFFALGVLSLMLGLQACNKNTGSQSGNTTSPQQEQGSQNQEAPPVSPSTQNTNQ